MSNKNKGVYENQQNKKMRPSKVSNDRNVPAPTPEAQSFPGLNDNISDAEENVNEKGPRYSLSLENSYDSDGRQLTSQFDEGRNSEGCQTYLEKRLLIRQLKSLPEKKHYLLISLFFMTENSSKCFTKYKKRHPNQ